MTVVLPNVSTAGNRRITAPRLAIRDTPIAKVMVTAAGSPSGIAPTASAIAAVKVSTAPCPRNSPIPNVTAASPRMATVNTLLNPASFFVSGVASVSAAPTNRWISPNSVSAPVATITPVPVPAVTKVPEYAMLRRSATGADRGTITSSLDTGADSPVSADSSARNSANRISRRSAGTLSPASRCTRSPGTSASDGIVCSAHHGPPGPCAHHRPQALQCRLRLRLLNETDDRIDDDHAEDHR